MEGMNGRVSFPFPMQHEIFNQVQNDHPIRRFCPARVEQQGGDLELEELYYHDHQFELWSPTDTTTPHLATSEEEEFADSFFNMDCYSVKDDSHSPLPLQNHDHQVFDDQDELIENFSMVNDVYGDVPSVMIVDEEYDLDILSSSFEDYGVVPDMMPSVELEEEASHGHGVDQGLHLVHLLLACAEAVGCRDTQLAHSILTQIWPSVSPWGDSLQRVSYCFAMGLKYRLSLLLNVNANGAFTDGAMDVSLITREEKIEAFQLLHQTTPYVAFGFMAANDAISQAAQGKDSLHIIDLGMEHTLQWPSLIRTLASRPEGPPKVVRITGIVGDDDQSLSFELETSMKGLIDETSLTGIALEFHTIAEPATAAVFTREKLKLREEEALFVNSIMHLHECVKESRGSLKTILQAIKKLGPTLVTVVEQDANHNGPFFLRRFLESLHYYSAIFDSLEASLPRNSPQRMKIEKNHFAEEIRNIVAYEGSDRKERHERADQWRRQLGRAGFQLVGLKCVSQVRMMLSVYGCDGYSLSSEKGCLLLGWKGRPIMLASAWQLHN